MVTDTVAITLEHPADFSTWRVNARACLENKIEPQNISWFAGSANQDLFGAAASAQLVDSSDTGDRAKRFSHATIKVPAAFMKLAELAVCHTDQQRFGLLYRVLWRITHGERTLLDRHTDDDVYRLSQMARAVRRDRHKMTAFVRFRQYTIRGNDYYHAWFEPDHHILRLTSGFFCRRFSNMLWSLSTPAESSHWNGRELTFGASIPPATLPDGEEMEDLWLIYFQNIFNPSRLRTNAMRAEMPVKYWKNLPESRLIEGLTRDAGPRSQSMLNAGPSKPSRYSLNLHGVKRQ